MDYPFCKWMLYYVFMGNSNLIRHIMFVKNNCIEKIFYLVTYYLTFGLTVHFLKECFCNETQTLLTNMNFFQGQR